MYIRENREARKDRLLFKLCTTLQGFKLEFSKIFWGGAHRDPSPDPSPRSISGFALGSGFALSSRALRALDSGFALNSRALRALDSGFALNLPPPKFDREWLLFSYRHLFFPPIRALHICSIRQTHPKILKMQLCVQKTWIFVIPLW